MTGQVLIAGGGIGGLAAAIAAGRAGWMPRVIEQAPVFSEVGAGLQLGPNATRVLRSWGLLEAIEPAACAPMRLVSRDAGRGRDIAALPLGDEFLRRYGAPYLTVHRADLQAALLAAASSSGADLRTGLRAERCEERESGVHVHTVDATGQQGVARADALVAADGVWSGLRQQLLRDGPPRASDHVALRGLVPLASLPAQWRAAEVAAWLGPRLHIVTYPVRGGAWLNVVCVLQQVVRGEREGWDRPAAADAMRSVTPQVCPALRGLFEAVPGWSSWVLHDREPVRSAAEMARGRVALLGDAAHPMRPYLAQGAAMALEDAAALGRVLAGVDATQVPPALQAYAAARWERCARVQRRSLRNAAIFHATGPVRLARDAALRSLGARLMDLPWLYGHAA